MQLETIKELLAGGEWTVFFQWKEMAVSLAASLLGTATAVGTYFGTSWFHQEWRRLPLERGEPYFINFFDVLVLIMKIVLGILCMATGLLALYFWYCFAKATL